MSAKRLTEAYKQIEERAYSLDDAIKCFGDMPKAKFDETIDIAINLGVDPRHADQMVRGMFTLPNSLGKSVKIAAIVSDSFVDDAKKAGADIVGGEEVIDDIKNSGINFDRCIASIDMMPKIGKIAKILGPKGLMPNPKLGTATNDVAGAISEAKSGQLEYRVEKSGIVHAGVAKVSFSSEKIVENILSFVKEIQKVKPSGAKGTYFKRIYISSTMGPSIELDVAELLSRVS